MYNFGLVGSMKTLPENRDGLVNILRQAADLMQTEADCHTYTVHLDAADTETVWVIEMWTTRESHDAALQRADVRALIGQALPLLTEQPGGTTLIPVGGKGF